MKNLITSIKLSILVFLSAFSARANDCITNINVACVNGWTFTIANTEGASGSCWNPALVYTNINCREVMGNGSCFWGTFHGTYLLFSRTNCPSSATDVATVTYACNTAVPCQMTEGGPNYCGAGSNFTITAPSAVDLFVVALTGGTDNCCSLDWCEIGRHTCLASGGGGGD